MRSFCPSKLTGLVTFYPPRGFFLSGYTGRTAKLHTQLVRSYELLKLYISAGVLNYHWAQPKVTQRITVIVLPFILDNCKFQEFCVTYSIRKILKVLENILKTIIGFL